jgi:hypothetical protein
MDVWIEMSSEYQKLLSNVRVFRDVQVIYVDSNREELKFFKDKKQTKAFSIKELTNFHNDKLIFLITDMLSLSWKSGDAFSLFSKLYRNIPLYIIQVLPYRLWRSTELKKASISTLSSKEPYPTSKSYSSEIDYLLKALGGDKNSLRLPLVNFELSYLKVIGKTLKAKEGNRIDGAILDFDDISEESKENSQKDLTAYERVDRFFSNSSPKAQKLAKSLTAVPLNLAIMRMIQEKIVGETGNIYIAEVINSNLLTKKNDIFQYDDEVHDVLFKLLGREQALDIVYKNSDYIQENLNTQFGFKALLRGDIDLDKIEMSDNDKVFASISCKILKSIGYDNLDKLGCEKKTKKRVLVDSDEVEDVEVTKEPNILTIKELKTIISQKENEKLEFKARWNQSIQELVRYILALANGSPKHIDETAYFIIGVDERNKNSFELKRDDVLVVFTELQELLKEYVKPEITGLLIEWYNLEEDNGVLVISIPPQNHLISLSKDLKTKKGVNKRETVYYRIGESIHVASPDVIREFDKAFNSNTKSNELLQCDEITKYVVKIKSKESTGSGFIVKLDSYPNNFFVFTAKHIFIDNYRSNEIDINMEEVLIDYKNEIMSPQSFIVLDADMIVFIFDNSVSSSIYNL